MPGGETVARIDGPDRRGWVFASPTLAYYPMTRHGPDSTTTIHRIDLGTGSRKRIVTDARPVLPFLDEPGAAFTALALTADKHRLLVGRALLSEPRVWIGRYDAATGALETGRSWPIVGSAANVRLASAGDVFVLVTSTSLDGRVAQSMRFLDEELRDVAAELSDLDLPSGERCSAALQAFEGGRWATVCAAPEGRYASVLFLHGAHAISSRVSVKLDALERVIAWNATGGSVGILTDRARHLRVGADGGLTSFWIGEPDGRTVIRIAREIAPGIAVGQLNIVVEGEPIGDIVLVDIATGRVLARTAQRDSAIDFVGGGDRLYALLPGRNGEGPRLQRLDRNSLVPVGTAATLPQRDDTTAGGLITVATPP